ncbi:MAG: ATP-binding protein [Candidatus Aminicenantes bacterium]|nr:ATP-binding protein [Candidatus Aminicenantes bacterium]
MKGLPIGIQTFSKLIERNYLYIDKTECIYNLIKGGGYYFLSRPRRFGKSLLVSTLKEIFSGSKELFKGLWIYDKIAWDAHPVIHIDFLGLSYAAREEMVDTLDYLVNRNAENHGIELKEKGYDKRFRELIIKLSQRNKVVALVDEYDKPIIDFVEDRETALRNRDILKSFYSILKGMDEYLEFVFITGVSKFSKVSVFSDLNNLNDITMDEKYSVLLGYTQEELLRYFDRRLEGLAGKEKKEQWLEDIRAWYNGYSWDGKNFVYNPYSILHLFKKGRFANYWFESGSPSFLVKLIRKYNIDLPELEAYKAGEEVFSSFDIDRMHVVSLLFQTGYLTVKEVVPAGRRKRFYILSYPNLEVKEAFLVYLLGDFSPKFADRISVVADDLRAVLQAGDTGKFFEIVRSIFAQIPYDIFVQDREGYYQTVIYLLLKLIGINIHTEVETNIGRLDAVIETENIIYILEFKLGTAEEALEQIKEKKYYERYLGFAGEVKLIGVGFDVEQRNIAGYKIEGLPKAKSGLRRPTF